MEAVAEGNRWERISGKLLGASAALILCVALLGVWSVATKQLANLNSDATWIVNLYREVFVRHQSIASWSFSEAPSFFPDMPLFALAMSVSSTAWAAFVVYDLLFFTLLFLAVYYAIPPLTLNPPPSIPSAQ